LHWGEYLEGETASPQSCFDFLFLIFCPFQDPKHLITKLLETVPADAKVFKNLKPVVEDAARFADEIGNFKTLPDIFILRALLHGSKQFWPMST